VKDTVAIAQKHADRLPFSPSTVAPKSSLKVYGSLISTIGSRRRSALTESFNRVSSFSRTSKSARARCHSDRDTTGGIPGVSVIRAACHRAPAADTFGPCAPGSNSTS
jgi:hypothetical protein